VKKQRINLYTRFERLWHWVQALFFIVLFLTGFEIHGCIRLMGYERAYSVHTYVGWSLLILTVFAVFWHLTTGAWRNYVPTSENILKVADFYLRGIFRGEPHPHEKTQTAKLNPLQRLAYLWLNVFAIPLIFATGILYFFYNSWSFWGINISLGVVAVLHTVVAYLLLAFAILHVYLTSTGGTVWTYIKEMITGYEEIDVHQEPA
jgi:thiosulfate reductase cytochrome b subunit